MSLKLTLYEYSKRKMVSSNTETIAIRQGVAPTGKAIKVLSSIIVASTAGLIVASVFKASLLAVGSVLAIIVVLCYMRTPVEYEVKNNQLRILMRIGEKRFEPVVKCSLVEERVNMGIRLWGNGGLFAATGVFWSKKNGVFRAYITAYKSEELVEVEIGERKVYISPENPASFVLLSKSMDGY